MTGDAKLVALAALATAFFSRVALLTSSGTGAYSHSRCEREQFRQGDPPQHRIFLQVRAATKVRVERLTGVCSIDRPWRYAVDGWERQLDPAWWWNTCREEVGGRMDWRMKV